MSRHADVIWVVGGNEGFGILESTRVEIAALTDAGHAVTVVALHAGAITEAALGAGAKVHIVDASPVRSLPSVGAVARARAALSWASQVRLAASVVPLLATPAADAQALIHVRSPNLLLLAGSIGRRTGRRVMWQIPSFMSNAWGLTLRRVGYRMLMAYGRMTPIANSAATAQHFSFLGELPVLYVPIDTRRFRPETTTDAAGRPIEFLSLARVSESKGQTVLLEAFERCRSAGGAARLRFVGLDGRPESERLRGLVAVSPYRADIDLLDRVENPAPEITRADVVIVGQRQLEPFGQAAAQAMCMGRPVLAVGEGGPRELVERSGAGWSCDFEPVAIAEQMQRIAADPRELAEKGQSAETFSRHRFEPAAFVDSYLALATGRKRQKTLTRTVHRIYRALRLDRLRLQVERRRLERAGARVINDAGIHLHVDPTDDRAVLLSRHRGALDHRAVGIWKQLVGRFDPQCVIDVGANYGEVSLSTGAIGGLTYLVEPNPSVAAALRRTLASLPPTTAANYRLIERAASDRPGSTTLHVGRSSGTASIEKPHGAQRGVEVSSVRLDDEIELPEGVRLLFKIDVEGHECSVIRGMSEVLAHRPFIGLVEILHLDEPDLRWISDHFTVFVIPKESPQLEHARPCRVELLDRETRRTLMKDVVLGPAGLAEIDDLFRR